MKKVLVLGAGLVSRPLVDYLATRNIFVHVASRTVSKAEALVHGHSNGKATQWLVDNIAGLKEMVEEADVVVSLLPYTYHLQVAEVCLECKTHMVTTSYVKEEMRNLDGRAKQAGILILNEIGLDPGIDHLSAMKVIHAVEDQGGRVVSFRSYCGGLPAPEDNTNPWGYKYSWSLSAVLSAGLNPARYLEDGEEIDIPGPELFAHHWPVEIPGTGWFEGYPNRNSLGYLDTYGLQHARTMFRGTLRYPGWCNAMKLVVDLGLLSRDQRADLAGRTHAEVLATLVPGATPGTVQADLARHAGLAEDADPLRRLAWAGFFSDEPVGAADTLFDLVGARLLLKLPYAEGERDMIVLHHEFEAELPGGSRKRILSTLVEKGIPGGDSAMARTVSLPAAVASRLILAGEIQLTGVHIPVQPEIYNPVLAELETLGIRCQEQETPLA